MKKLKKLLWCSPHAPTTTQIKSFPDKRIVLLEKENLALSEDLAKNKIDTNLYLLADELLVYAMEEKYEKILQPGGSPAFQFILGQCYAEMKKQDELHGTYPNLPEIAYAFSKRVSEDIPQADGTVKKVSVFNHEGWV